MKTHRLTKICTFVLLPPLQHTHTQPFLITYIWKKQLHAAARELSRAWCRACPRQRRQKCTVAVRVFAGDLPLAPYVSHEGYKHTTNLCSKQERKLWCVTHRSTLSSWRIPARWRRRSRRRRSPPRRRRCCHRNARSHTLSLSPSSIHTHAYTHVSTQGRRRWSWSKSTSL